MLIRVITAHVQLCYGVVLERSRTDDVIHKLFCKYTDIYYIIYKYICFIYVPVAMDDEQVVAGGTVEACCELPDDLPGVLKKICLDPTL